MQIATLVSVLDNPQHAAEQLQSWGLVDPNKAQQMLQELAEAGITLDLLASLCGQLAERLPETPDADGALDAIRRVFLAVRSPLALAAVMERDRESLPVLLAALALSPRWAEVLITDPEAFDLLRQTVGQQMTREAILGDVLVDSSTLSEERLIAEAFSRHHQRHLLRIAYAETIGGCGLGLACEQLSLLAEALVEAALDFAQRKTLQTRSLTQNLKPERLRCTVLALGKLGAAEMDYAAPLNLLFVYDASTEDAAAFRAVSEHFDRVAKHFVRLLRSTSNHQPIYEVRLMSLPDSPAPLAAHSAEDALIGLDSFGRTWHRQAMLKARPIAGDRELGTSLLGRLESWRFRRYLSRADEAGIKALKRSILLEATLNQDECRDVRLGRGGLRDLEATVEFLQLLAGGDQPVVRVNGTLAAIAALEHASVLTAAERRTLEKGFLFLGQIERRLQVLLGTGTTALPADEALIQRLATSLTPPASTAGLAADVQTRLETIWETLRKLLDSAFPEEPTTPREVELLLNPATPPDEVRAALGPFGFSEPRSALDELNDLASEQVPFLSTRRCRHLLAAILPQLLTAISATPNPDRTLCNLARVSNSLGGKAVLWELFRASPPSLALYVRLCAGSPYLSDILTTNPGMIDVLLDSLQLDKLPTRQELKANLNELCRGASDTLPILHDFKNAQHLRIGVRDILGKEDVDRAHQALADVAEMCLSHVAELEYRQLVDKFGAPTMGPGPEDGNPCGVVIVALGKLGGREPNYHSDLDVLWLYDAEGVTRHRGPGRRERTSNNHFFTQLAQRVAKQLSQLTPQGRLYTVDSQLRPIGVAGALAMSIGDFVKHFTCAAAPVWQWQALCQARPVFGEDAACGRVAQLIRQLLVERRWSASDRDEIRRTRDQLESAAAPQNLKRAAGGTLDIEFLVQMLQLQHASDHPGVLIASTQEALATLATAGVLPGELAQNLGDSYRFLRRIESGLRLLNTSARHDLPMDPQQLHQLAFLLGHGNPQRLREQCLAHMAENRAIFNEWLAPT